MQVAVNYSGYGIILSDEGRQYIAERKKMALDDVTDEYIESLSRHDEALVSCIDKLGEAAIKNDPEFGRDMIALEEIDTKRFTYEMGDSIVYATGAGCESIDVKLNEDFVRTCVEQGDSSTLIDTMREANISGPALDNSQEEKYEVLLDPRNTIKREIVAYNPQTERMEAEVVTFHRVRAKKDFGDVKAGQLGGHVESASNLSQEGDCWIGDNAFVGGKATVSDSAIVDGNALVTGQALINGNATVTGEAKVSGNCHIYGYARVEENATIDGKADIEDATICGYAHIGGNAEIHDDIMITGDTEITAPMEFNFDEQDPRIQTKEKVHEMMNFNNEKGEEDLLMDITQSEDYTQEQSLRMEAS